MSKSDCPRCKVALVEGVALRDDKAIQGSPDFVGDSTVSTVTMRSSGKRHRVLKCPLCGASYEIIE